MSGIRIKNKDLYRIEVNDNGEYIEFDLSDIGLSYKFVDTLEQIEKLELEFNKKIKELPQNENKDTLKQTSLLEQEMFNRMRQVMDNFLGENACQKIFGNRNYYEMYYDLLEELSKPRKELNGKSHLDKIAIKSENIRKRITEKYKKTRKSVI